MIKKYPRIDVIDSKIINNLIENSRQNYSQIARKVGASKEVVRYRIKNLEKKEILKGYKILINYKIIGLQLYELILKLKKVAQEKEKKFIEFLKNSKVLSYGNCIGEFDFNIFLAVNDNEKLIKFIDYIKKIFGEDIESIDILINVREEYIFGKYIKLKKDITIKDVEIKLLNLLLNQPNIMLKEISCILNRSYPFIIKSIRKLEKSGVIKAYYPDIDFKRIGLSDYSIFIKTRYMTEEDEKKFLNYIINEPSFFWYAKYIGKYDYNIEVIVKGSAEFKEKLDDIISKFGDKITELKTVYIKSGEK